MIKRIESLDSIEVLLRNSHYSRIILSHMNTYGTDYDFCEFYELRQRNKRIGILCSFNNTVTADILSDVSAGGTCVRELSEFIYFKRPGFVQMPQDICPRTGLRGYKRVKRCFFEIPCASDSNGLDLDPDIDRVYNTAFASLDVDYGLWLTDTVRRRNLGLLNMYGYKTSVLTVRCSSKGEAYISDVATPPSDRRKGQACALLKKTAKLLKDEGYTAYLCALEPLWEFYNRIGCKIIGTDIAYQAKTKDDK